MLIVWYLAIKFDSPDYQKKQPLISSGLRKLQASEVAAFKLSVVYRQEGSNDWKGGFQQVGQRIAPESGHRSDGEPRGWRDLRAGMTKRPRNRTTPRERAERGKEEREVAEIGSNDGFDEGERGSLTLVIALVVGGKLGE